MTLASEIGLRLSVNAIEPVEEHTYCVSSQHSIYAHTESVTDATASNFTDFNYYAGPVED